MQPLSHTCADAVSPLRITHGRDRGSAPATRPRSRRMHTISRPLSHPANAAGTADPFNNPTLRSVSDAGWGQTNQTHSRPTGDPHFYLRPSVPQKQNKIANSFTK